MSHREVGGSFGLGLLFFAALFARAPQASGPPPTHVDAETKPRLEEPAADSLSLVSDFLGTTDPKALSRGGYKLGFVIATLPDPVDSHFGSQFDRGLEAIVGALSDAGYSLDRWTLPWRTSTGGEYHATWTPPGEGIAQLKVGPASEREHEDHPGAVLFRKGSNLLLLFIVGETPTHGLHKRAFEAALEAVAAARGRFVAGSVEVEPMRILGPYFSGTATSLRLALDSWPSYKVEVLSGSATSDTNKTVIEEPGRISYQTTTNPDGALVAALDRYLRNQNVSIADDVALLVEDGTAYGSGFVAGGADCDQEPPSVKRPCLLLRFPLQISQLRSAYEKLEAGRRASGPVLSPRRSLEFSLEGPKQPKDALPPYEPRMTANADELVLASAFDTVRRRRIRYLGVVASDTRDVLFLARKAREFGVDAHLFTFGADVLYQHPDTRPALDGLLVVTTYPLFGPYQAWHHSNTRGGTQYRSFPGSSEEGIYNAMLLFLGEPDRTIDYAMPPIGTPEGVEKHRPPVWIVANGRHGFWPLAFSGHAGSLLKVAQVRPHTEQERWPTHPVPSGALVLSLGWSAAAALFVYGYRRYRPADSPPSATEQKPVANSAGGFPGAGTLRDRLRTFFSGCEGQTHVFMNVAAMAGLAVVLAVVEESLALQFGSWALIGPRSFRQTLLIASVVGLGALLGLAATAIAWAETGRLIAAFRSMKTEKDDPSTHERLGRQQSAERVLRAFVINAVFLAFFAGYGLLVSVYTLRTVFDSQLFLALSRSFDLDNRLGPLLPFSLGSVVLALFAMCLIRRSLLYEEQRLRPPEGVIPQSLLALLEPYGAFTQLIRDPGASWLASVAPLVGLAIFHALFVGGGLYRSLDGAAWNALGTLLICFGGWSVAWGVLEFRAIWRRLSALLKILSWSPLADAFNRMPDGLAKSQWKMWRTPPTLTSLHVSVAHLNTLVNGAKVVGLTLDADVLSGQQDANSEFTRALAWANAGHASTQTQRKTLRTHLAKATLGVFRMLESAWTSWPSKADIADKSEKEQQSLNTVVWLRRQVPTPPDVIVRIAEEYVAVRFVSFIHYAFSHLRNVLSFTLAGFVLLMTLIASYPFEPLHPVVAIGWVLGLLGIATVMWTFVDMDRDLILSYIAKTRPGQVNLSLEFVTKVVVYGLLPLMTLLATQFPEVGDWALTLLNPALRVH